MILKVQDLLSIFSKFNAKCKVRTIMKKGVFMKTINHIYGAIVFCVGAIAALGLLNNPLHAMPPQAIISTNAGSGIQRTRTLPALPASRTDGTADSTALVPYQAEQSLQTEPYPTSHTIGEPYIAELLESTPTQQLPTATLPIAPSLNASPAVIRRLEQINLVNTKIKEFQQIKDNPTMLMFALKTLTQLIMSQAPQYGAAAISLTATAEALYPLINNLNQLLIAKGILSSTPNQEVVIDALHAISKAIDQKLEYHQDYVLAIITLAVDFIETKATKSWPQESGTLKTAAQNLNTLVATLNTPDNKEAVQSAYEALQSAQKAINATSYYAPDKRAALAVFKAIKPVIDKIIHNKLYEQRPAILAQPIRPTIPESTLSAPTTYGAADKVD